MRTIIFLIYTVATFLHIASYADQEGKKNRTLLEQYVDIVNQVGQKSALTNTGYFNYQIKILPLFDSTQKMNYELVANNKINGFDFIVRLPQSQMSNQYFQKFAVLQLDLFFNTFQYFDQNHQPVDLRYDMQKFIFFARTIPRLRLPRILSELNLVDFHWMTPISAYETYINSNNESLNGQLYFHRHLKNVIQILNESILIDQISSREDYLQFVNYLKEAYNFDKNSAANNLDHFVEQMELKIKNLNHQSEIWYRDGIKQYELRKKNNQSLLLESDLAALVKGNFRSEVAQIMNIIIPWEILEPSELRYWNQYVDSIRNPNYEQSFIVFRGSDEKDRLQLIVDQEKNIHQLALFSKKITTGSGSHIYRLLGLPQLFERNSVLGNQDYFKPNKVPHTFSALITNHSINPLGSTMISWSLSPDIAFRFVTSMNSIVAQKNQDIEKIEKDYLLSAKSGAIIAARIDPRRLFINSFSGYRQELEVVAPLIVFPDEVIHFKKGLRYAIYKDGELKKFVNETVVDFQKRLTEKVKLLESHTTMNLTKNPNEVFQQGLQNLVEQFAIVKVGHRNKSCGQIFNQTN